MTASPPRPEPAHVAIPKELVAVFADLAGTVYAGDAVEDVLANVCDVATAVVPGCDHATVMARKGGRLVTMAANDETGRAIDGAERDLQDGPCVDALLDQTAQLAPDLGVGGPWPTLRAWVLEHTPVRGAMAFRLIAEDTKVGALNLFSDTAGAFTSHSADVAAILAAFASVATTATTERLRAEDLRAGLESNREIGKAIGLLMAFHNITDEEAFDVLRRHSQETNEKIAAIARKLLEHHNRH